jgi:isoleucyl-tRNA synthetase
MSTPPFYNRTFQIMTLRDTKTDPKSSQPEGGRPELKSTLLLPRTGFPMKANLPENEPKRLAMWAENGLYEQIRQARTGAPKYILHDGPPYANGPIHLGHA